MTFNGTSYQSSVPQNIGELKIGYEHQFKKNLNIWGDMSYAKGSNNFKSYGFKIGGTFAF